MRITPDQKTRAERRAPYADEPPWWLTLAVADPGAFVKRGREEPDDDGHRRYEPLPRWQARAVIAAVSMHEEFERQEQRRLAEKIEPWPVGPPALVS